MIPTNSQDNNFEFQELPSKTYKIQQFKDEERLYGFIDELDALKQSIYLTLNIERYQYVIYSWNYGIELKELMGKDSNFVIAELPRLITEALLEDDRILEITDFNFEKNKNKVHCTFTVKSIYGDIEINKDMEF